MRRRDLLFGSAGLCLVPATVRGALPLAAALALPGQASLAEVAARLAAGLDPRAVEAALLSVTARRIRPRPYLGPAFHAAMTVSACGRAAAWPCLERRGWALLWGVDFYHQALATFTADGGTPLGPSPAPAEGDLPGALAAYDEAAVDALVVGRIHRGEAVLPALIEAAVRDTRDIGHKAIWLSGAWDSLDATRGADVQSVVRSIALAALHREDPPEASYDTTWRHAAELAREAPPRPTEICWTPWPPIPPRGPRPSPRATSAPRDAPCGTRCT